MFAILSRCANLFTNRTLWSPTIIDYTNIVNLVFETNITQHKSTLALISKLKRRVDGKHVNT